MVTWDGYCLLNSVAETMMHDAIMIIMTSKRIEQPLYTNCLTETNKIAWALLTAGTVRRHTG